MSLSPENALAISEGDMIPLRARWLNRNKEGVVNRDAALLALRENNNAAGCGYADLRGVSFYNEDLTGIDFSRCDLSGADLTEANLSQARFTHAQLVGAQLVGARLDSVKAVGADFSGANLSECHGAHASFGACNMTDVIMFGSRLDVCTFSKAKLVNADLRTCNLAESRFCGADLEQANFAGAILQRVDFTDCRVDKAVFNDTDLRGAILRRIISFRTALWVSADIRDVDFCGAYLLRRHIMDENYLYEFQNYSKMNARLFRAWRLTSDCGRSLLRWGISVLVIVLLFAALYTQLDIDYGDYETRLSPIYFSIVTITTLGYGDVLPVSMAAQIACIAEVVTGYMALGGMLSIFANKMARRAE
jgi:uncharacterized protein YjbI with pentapeptide repeats